MYQEKIKLDWVTIGLWLAIMLFGWVNIYAAGYNADHSVLFDFSVQHGKQFIWIAVALILAVIIASTEPRVFSNTAYPIYGIVMGLLVLTLFLAVTVNGGKSWIDFGFFRFQPSEFAKFATALAIAKYLSTIGIDMRDMRTKIVAAILIAVPAALILLQHDTGSALVFVGFIFPLYREGLSGNFLIIGVAAIALFVLALLVNKYVLLAILFGAGLFYLFLWLNKRSMRDYWRVAAVFACCAMFIFSVDFVFNNVLEPHQRGRIDVLLGKTEDLQGSGYNVNQSKIAIGSGGIIGKGFLKGTLTKADFVPEQETDFIFCTVGEEWGFFGSAILVTLYVVLLIRLINMAERQRSPFARIYGYSVASILFIHLFVNVGMVLGLVPVIGIPLPFFSYGGSSLLAFTILLFIFIRQDAAKNQLL
ncbi:MAG: rod shape-determining protein RodA [Bacteroidales bacterium]|nr:rod shape-determining protein RodA [Bacteroidales bacterium]MBQ6956156.1 rod shape-determining protein RodA [Bacteroidales bacterium]